MFLLWVNTQKTCQDRTIVNEKIVSNYDSLKNQTDQFVFLFFEI